MDILIATIFGFITAYSLFFLWIMIYAWEDPEEIENNQAPKAWSKPKFSFTALIPAHREEDVIAQTLRSIEKIDYPKELKEAIVVCSSNDLETIRIARDTIYSFNNPRFKIVTFSDEPINKPHGLNIALKHATSDAIVVFDAEDEPHKNLYTIANTVLTSEKYDVLQFGIQLMNFRSYWFSILNVLEYFFWFKSALHFFSKSAFTPLGGNTLFIKKPLLQKIGGWDPYCLTEDADLGVRLSLAGAKIKIVYDEKYATQEETPHTVSAFIKQRSRWNQGFLQILIKGDWFRLPKLSQKVLAFYLFTWPFIQLIFFLFIPLSILMNLSLDLPVGVTMLSYVPLYLLLFIQITTCIGLYEFCREYKKQLQLTDLLKVLLFFLPYQFLLGISSLRSIYRTLTNNLYWEKTLHLNVHRQLAQT